MVGDLRSESEVVSQHHAMDAKIKKIEDQLDKLLEARDFAQDAARDFSTTAVLGGLQGSQSMAAAEQFVKDKLWCSYSPCPNSIYTKGDFKGLI